MVIVEHLLRVLMADSGAALAWLDGCKTTAAAGEGGGGALARLNGCKATAAAGDWSDGTLA